MNLISKSVLLEGMDFYLRSFLFVSPRRRFARRLIRRIAFGVKDDILMNSVFLVYNRDVGPLYVDGSRFYLYTHSYEPRTVKKVRKLFKRDRGLFIDVGAYVGLYTVLAAKMGWRVLALEPNPISFILLKYNVKMHGIRNKVVLARKAAGSVCGISKFTLAESPSESSFTLYLRPEVRYLDLDVEVDRLDNLIMNSDLSRGIKKEPKVIKIDVEGAGLEVVRGAMEVIRRFRPTIIMEVHRTFDETDEANVLNLLRPLGYTYEVLEPRSSENFILTVYPKNIG